MKHRILLVDDESIVRETFGHLLSKVGFEVVETATLGASLDYLAQFSVDIIIADIYLSPTSSGLEIARYVQKEKLACPVILMTGLPSMDSSLAAVRLNVFEYLVKPVLPENLIHCVNKAVTHKQLIDENIRIQRENEELRKLFQTMFNSIEDAIISVNNRLEILHANPVATKLLTVDFNSEIVAFSESNKHPLITSLLTIIKETFTRKKSIHDQRIHYTNHNNNEEKIFSVSSSLMEETMVEPSNLNSRSDVKSLVLVARDVSRLVTLETKLQNRQKFHGIVGASDQMQKLYLQIENLMNTDLTVLITGDSGTGKELVAKAIHQGGDRQKFPLICVDCTALSENLLESELFGHAKGAFTGAVTERIGRIEAADKGMLFLDEISNISPLIQKKLLRFLQEREFERVGEIKTRQVDIQVVAASNQNLWQMVERGEFREDLYWRLKVFEIHLSPLRERIADLPLLFTHFMTKINQRLQRQIYDMTNECWTIFRGYHWPGNIRELLSVCEYAAVLCKKNQISVEHLPRELQAVVLNNYRPNTPKHTAKIQITDLRNALEKCHGKRQATADLLGISRQTLYRKMKEHNIS